MPRRVPRLTKPPGPKDKGPTRCIRCGMECLWHPAPDTIREREEGMVAYCLWCDEDTPHRYLNGDLGL